MTDTPEESFDLERLKEQLENTVQTLAPKEIEKIEKATQIAEKAHCNQTRAEGGPYFLHPLRAALILAQEMDIMNCNLICALLCHDVLEDTEITANELEEKLGPQVTKLVKKVTRCKPQQETKEQKRTNRLQMIEKIANSSREVRLIKLCDRLDNRRSQEYISPEHPCYKKISRWNNEFKSYPPIARKTHPQLYKLFKQFIRSS